jgi:hypothetical protein
MLPHLGDHGLQVYVITELLNSLYWQTYNPEALIAQGLEHCEQIHDPALKCKLHVQHICYDSCEC